MVGALQLNAHHKLLHVDLRCQDCDVPRALQDLALQVYFQLSLYPVSQGTGLGIAPLFGAAGNERQGVSELAALSVAASELLDVPAYRQLLRRVMRFGMRRSVRSLRLVLISWTSMLELAPWECA